MTGPQAQMLSGDRLHLNQGPIDLILGARGPGRAAFFAAATARFQTVLQELVAELANLRRADPPPLSGPVARRMQAAITPLAVEFVTPMAAVAGAVADEILQTAPPELPMAYVNNGGDIAFQLAPGQSFAVAMVGGSLTLPAAAPWRGLATSGRGGRSHSLGIADAVTVIARTAAQADAAATMIANRVDLPGHPAISRMPACHLSPDSDLGDRPVTTGLARLTAAETAQALAAGAAYAETLQLRGLIGGAQLCLNGATRQTGPDILTKDPAHA
ncbi:UPF0280 family protein [Pseudooceanicola sp.]|uniref:UPF0280 family protein n=1 Tax=Pseudooceanicola sp. TaxID=1914328 RepID=UPI00261B74E7|nr:UPF0280 family protein [Pseudooceanicola sp.]MDF1855641.1 UPF0280 family protein [Pseudooceanicola sp.]